VKWEFVGDGTRDAPYNARAPEYLAFWQAQRDNSQRQQPLSLTDVERSLPRSQRAAPMLSDGVPNVFLLRRLSACGIEGIRLATFMYGVPFRACVLDERCFRTACTNIEMPRAGGDNLSWCPVTPEPSGAGAPSASGSRLYCALVLRLKFLTQQLVMSQEALGNARKVAPPSAESRNLAYIVDATQQWIDAHWMLVCAIRQLGAVPNDDNGPEWAVLLERYTPDVNMIFHRGELPSLYSRLIRVPFFSSATDKVLEYDALLRSLRKVLPVRCASRDSASKDAGESARSRAFFCFMKSILAAVLLGVYEQTVELPGWRMRQAIYELFFFSLDTRLHSAREPRTDGRLGGSRAALRADFALDRELLRLGNDVRIVLGDYTALVRANYVRARAEMRATEAAAVSTERAAARAANAAPIIAGTEDAPVAIKRARSGSASAGGSSSAAARRRRAAAEEKDVSATIRGRSASAAAQPVDVVNQEIRAGFALANAISRLQIEQERGLHHYQQCKAANTLPCDASGKQCAPPVPPDTEISDVYALRNILPCDERLPETLLGDEIVFEFIHARSESVSRVRQAAASGTAKPAAHYVHQAVIVAALRAFLCNSLRRHACELRRELCARTQWAEWESLIAQMLDYTRRSLSLKCDEQGDAGRPGIFLSHYPSFNCLASGGRTVPINNLYRNPPLPFSETVELEIEKFLVNHAGLDRRADLVMPAEYEIVLTESIRRLDYARSYPPPQLPSTAGDATATDDATTSMTDASTTAAPPPPLLPYTEWINREAPPPFSILPTKAVPPDNATLADIRRDYVERNRVPLCAFRATPQTVDLYNAAHQAYNTRTSPAKLVAEFVKTLAAVSMMQLQIVRAFVRAVNKHCRVYTFALPAYLERPVNVLLARSLRLGASNTALLPPHACRSAVCTHCYRPAVFVDTARKKHMASAIGTDRTKVVNPDGGLTTVNQRAIDNVLLRGSLLAIDQLLPAESLYKALNRRAFRARTVLNDVVIDDPLERVLPPVSAPPTDDEELEQLSMLLDHHLRVSVAVEPSDRRQQLPEFAHARIGEPSPALRAIGAGADNPVRAMLEFDEAAWLEYSRRTPTHKLLLGHNIATEQRDMRFDVVHYTDNPPNFKSEAKKQSRASETAASAAVAAHGSAADGANAATGTTTATITDPRKRGQRERSKQKSRRANVLSYLMYKECSQSDMFEFDRRHALVTGKARVTPPSCLDFYMCCCVCGVSVLRSDCTWRGAMLVCKNCVNVQPASSSSSTDDAKQQHANGDQMLLDSSLAAFDDGARASTTDDPIRALLRQSVGASAAVLLDEVVPEGAQCVVPRCWVVKTPETHLYGKEVLFDTRVGAARFGYVYVCAKHAGDRSWIFAPSTPGVLPMSMLLNLCLQNRARITPQDQVIDHLPLYIEQMASSQRLGRAVSDAEQMKRRQEKDAKRRAEVERELAGREQTSAPMN